jgi:signal transduction histidine kinase
MPQLFARYFRASNAKGLSGTGIGLNLVKALVELNGGAVRVESSLGEGSTFTIELPIPVATKSPGVARSATGKPADPPPVRKAS